MEEGSSSQLRQQKNKSKFEYEDSEEETNDVFGDFEAQM